MLQRNAPLPAGLSGSRARIGREFAHAFARHCPCPVARQPLRPVDIRDLQRLTYKQRTESGTIDEEIALDSLSRLEHDRIDEAVLAAQLDVDDLALNAQHAALF